MEVRVLQVNWESFDERYIVCLEDDTVSRLYSDTIPAKCQVVVDDTTLVHCFESRLCYTTSQIRLITKCPTNVYKKSVNIEYEVYVAKSKSILPKEELSKDKYKYINYDCYYFAEYKKLDDKLSKLEVLGGLLTTSSHRYYRNEWLPFELHTLSLLESYLLDLIGD